MTGNIIIVPELAVRVVTGDTCYQYENGFSAIYAEVAAEDSSLAQQLSEALKDDRIVTLRCAMLDVVGKVSKCNVASGVKTFILPIEDMTYRKPLGP
ncbi:MAG TPA: hypothetical protein VNX27_01620 [Chthoniobacterales bacterium]|jgi:hypothetical protein|nr:hypothetical protein [Chthoniobacterales bacterium]